MMNENLSDCRICKSSGLRYLFEANGFSIVRCSSCTFVQVKNLPANTELERIYSQDYFDNSKYVDDVAIKLELKRRINCLRKFGIKKPGKILDFGCATGDFVSYAQSHFDVWGTDVSNDALKQAKNLYPSISNKFLTLTELYAQTGQFDAITGWDVVEHLSDPKESLHYLKKLLKPNGIIILSTPNVGAFIAKIMRKRWAFMTPPEHLGFFNRNSITRLLSHLDFQVSHWKTRGKWVNLAFLIYKLNRVFPSKLLEKTYQYVSRSSFSKLCVYIPTGDIQYVGAKLKPYKVEL